MVAMNIYEVDCIFNFRLFKEKKTAHLKKQRKANREIRE